MGSTVNKDSIRESQLTSIILRNDFFKDKTVKRIKDIETQKKGVDIIVDGKKIDLKAQSDNKYVGNPSNTFCLELSTLDTVTNTKEKDGWFIKKDNETEDYGFMWIPKGIVNPSGSIRPEVIEYMQVPKKEIEKYIYSVYPKEELIELVKEYRSNPNKPPKYLNKFVKIMVANKNEKPIILVVNKSIYKSLATVHFSKAIKL